MPGVREAVARARRGAEVLHRAEDPVRHRGVGRHVVELRDRQHRRVPGRAAVGRDVHPAVVRRDHPPRVRGVDPHVVVVAVVDALHALDRLPAVHRLQHRHLREPHDVGVLRVDGERRVVPGPLPQRAVAARERPGLAPVVRAEEPALLRLDERVDALRIRRRDRDAHLAPDPLGEPFARRASSTCRRRRARRGARSRGRRSPAPRAGAAPATGRRTRCAGSAGRARRRRRRCPGPRRGPSPTSSRRPACGRRRARGWGRRACRGRRRRRRRGSSGGRPSCRSGRPASRRAATSCRRRWTCRCRFPARRCRGCWPRPSRRRRRSGRTAPPRSSRSSSWAGRRRPASSGSRRRWTSTLRPRRWPRST